MLVSSTDRVIEGGWVQLLQIEGLGRVGTTTTDGGTREGGYNYYR